METSVGLVVIAYVWMVLGEQIKLLAEFVSMAWTQTIHTVMGLLWLLNRPALRIATVRRLGGSARAEVPYW